MRSSEDEDRESRVEKALEEHERERRTLGFLPDNLLGILPEDLLLGQLAVQNGLVEPERIKECLLAQQEARSRGREMLLGEILVERGHLRLEDVLRLLGKEKIRDPEAPELPGFEIGGRVGEGATAVVYRAMDCRLKRPVALKVLKNAAGLSDIARQRFRRESEAAASLSHTNVVTVHGAGESDGRMYLVMEFVEGKPLSEVLREKSMDRRSLVVLLEKAARAVGAAHDKGIVHRDLKPANILVSAAGEPKVGDFGLAHLINSAELLTRTGATLGTPLYMSPEQVRGHGKDISPATDVYAMGAILYEILTGRAPHTSESLTDIYRKIAQEEPALPRVIDSAIETDLEAVTLKALEKNPRLRYPSGASFAEDLARYLAGEPVRARPQTPGLRRWRGLRRYGTPALTAVVLAVLAGVFVVGPRRLPDGRGEAAALIPESDSGLVAHWKLDDEKGSTTAVDATGKANGKLIGSAAFGEGKLGGALECGGKGSYVAIPNTDDLDKIQEGSYSLAAWFKPDGVPPGTDSANSSNYGILIKTGWHLGLYYTNEKKFLMTHWLAGEKPEEPVWTGASSWESEPGQWYHLVGVMDKAAGKLSIYVNGELHNSADFAANAAPRKYESSNWKIGIASPGAEQWSWPAKGSIDDVRIYGRALSAADVRSVHQGK